MHPFCLKQCNEENILRMMFAYNLNLHTLSEKYIISVYFYKLIFSLTDSS